jgi:hypothetical protein
MDLHSAWRDVAGLVWVCRCWQGGYSGGARLMLVERCSARDGRPRCTLDRARPRLLSVVPAGHSTFPVHLKLTGTFAPG